MSSQKFKISSFGTSSAFDPHVIDFSRYGNESLEGPAGSDGLDAEIPVANIIDGELIFTFPSSSTVNLGYINGKTGFTGLNGKTGPTGISGSNGQTITSTSIVNGELILNLSNGSVINLGNINGKTGSKGEIGLTGSTGNMGFTGPNGLLIESGSVNTDGNLILNIEGGSTINLGYVKGPTGLPGSVGLEGLMGPMGANGKYIIKSEIINGELNLTFSDNSTNNLGNVVGPTGSSSLTGPDFSPILTDCYSNYLYWDTNKSSWEIGSSTVNQGCDAAKELKGDNNVAIGYNAASSGKANSSVAIGSDASSTGISDFSIALGKYTQPNFPKNILINASTGIIGITGPSFYVNPIKKGETDNYLMYNSPSGSNEVTHALINSKTSVTIKSNLRVAAVGYDLGFARTARVGFPLNNSSIQAQGYFVGKVTPANIGEYYLKVATQEQAAGYYPVPSVYITIPLDGVYVIYIYLPIEHFTNTGNRVVRIMPVIGRVGVNPSPTGYATSTTSIPYSSSVTTLSNLKLSAPSNITSFSSPPPSDGLNWSLQLTDFAYLRKDDVITFQFETGNAKNSNPPSNEVALGTPAQPTYVQLLYIGNTTVTGGRVII